MKYLVWSNQRQAWWGPGKFGYTNDLNRAGRYSRDEALEICRSAMSGQYKPGGPLPEIAVPLADIIAALNSGDDTAG
jgi:hypothetical protein